MSEIIRYGIDVSEHNGQILWEKVKESGKVDFAMLRAGYGKGAIDRQFYRNADACQSLGIPFGVYWFSYAKSIDEAVREASHCLDVIGGYRLDYPVAFDFEGDSVNNCIKVGIAITGKDFATSLARSFLSVIKAAGYKAANYTNPAYLNRYFDIDQLGGYDLWLAQWPVNPNPKKQPLSQPEMWQYSSTGRIPGISGPVDLDVCYVDYLPKPEPVKSSVMDQPWAKEALALAKQRGISDGSRPEGPATRIEVMTMCNRAIDYVLNLSNHGICNPEILDDGK